MNSDTITALPIELVRSRNKIGGESVLKSASRLRQRCGVVLRLEQQQGGREEGAGVGVPGGRSSAAKGPARKAWRMAPLLAQPPPGEGPAKTWRTAPAARPAVAAREEGRRGGRVETVGEKGGRGDGLWKEAEMTGGEPVNGTRARQRADSFRQYLF